MKRAWLVTLHVSAALAISCGPGDHANAGLSDLFGGGAAGKAAPAPTRSELPDDTAPTATAGKGGVLPASGVTAGVGVRGAAGMAGRSPGSAGRAGVSHDAGATAGAAPGIGSAAGSAGKALAADTAGASAACGLGYLAVAGACVCDLNGTFAFHGQANVSLAATAPIEALKDTIELWGIVRHTYDAEGTLSLTLSACGQTSPEICAAAQAPILPNPEAYAQYVPVEVWDNQSPEATLVMSFPSALPGMAFDTPTLAELFGVTLANPLGAWPTTRKDVEGGPDFDGSAMNGARWVDLDADSQLGMTIKLVPPGGVAATANSGPPHSYAATSSKCPRSDSRAARSAYAYLPLPQGLGVKRIKRLYSAQRLALEFHGSLASCDRLTGMLTGANGDAPHLDGLIGGCAIVNGSGESACTSGLLDMTDSAGGGATAGLELAPGNFTFMRVADGVSCAQVRAMNFE